MAARTAPIPGPLFDPRPFLDAVDQDFAAFVELASMYGPISRQQFAGLSEALRRGDVAGARAQAHALKGSLALFGARPAIDLIARLEQDCVHGMPPDPESRLQDVGAVLAQVKAEMAAFCAVHDLEIED